MHMHRYDRNDKIDCFWYSNKNVYGGIIVFCVDC